MLGAEGISPAISLPSSRASQASATVKNVAAKTKEMATEMEATFLGMLLKEMRQTLDEQEGGLFPGDSGDIHGGLFDLYIGRHLADGGGIGLAASLLRQMQAAPTTVRKDTHHRCTCTNTPTRFSKASIVKKRFCAKPWRT